MQKKEIQYIAENYLPATFKEVSNQDSPLPLYYRERVSIDVIHDGAYIPPRFLKDSVGNDFNSEIVQEYYEDFFPCVAVLSWKSMVEALLQNQP